jgi:hypothetical protein
MADTDEEIAAISETIAKLPVAEHRVRLLTTLGGAADKACLSQWANHLFDRAVTASADIADAATRAAVLANVAQGYARMGRIERACALFERALDGAADNERVCRRIEATMARHDLTIPSSPVRQSPDAQKHDDNRSSPTETDGLRHILALYNTYEGGLAPAHLRALARAAPLCVAFGLDLLLVAFPEETVERLVERAVAETTTGRGGTYLQMLYRAGRITCEPGAPHRSVDGSDEPWLAVATTSRPGKGKDIDISSALKKAADHPSKRACFFMGLGPKGLPATLLHRAPFHLELTGTGVSLETCTAMGVLARALYDTIHELVGDPGHR